MQRYNCEFSSRKERRGLNCLREMCGWGTAAFVCSLMTQEWEKHGIISSTHDYLCWLKYFNRAGLFDVFSSSIFLDYSVFSAVWSNNKKKDIYFSNITFCASSQKSQKHACMICETLSCISKLEIIALLGSEWTRRYPVSIIRSNSFTKWSSALDNKAQLLFWSNKNPILILLGSLKWSVGKNVYWMRTVFPLFFAYVSLGTYAFTRLDIDSREQLCRNSAHKLVHLIEQLVPK